VASAPTSGKGETQVHSNPSSLHGRLAELESLVEALLGRQPSSDSIACDLETRVSTPQATLPLAQDFAAAELNGAAAADAGILDQKQSSTYAQSVHWEAVLTKIRGLKNDLVIAARSSSCSGLLYGPSCHMSRDEILGALPPRMVVDRLLAFHFDSHFVTPCR
jgi:hypothetical protein